MSAPSLRTLLPNNTDTTIKDGSSNSNNRNLTPDTSGTSATSGSNQPVSSAAIDKKTENIAHMAKKRKVPASITANACGNCKKARSKCDGKQPCGHCVRKNPHNEPCIYEPHVKNAKMTLVKDLKESRAIKHMAEKIFKCLANDTENEQEILERIKHGDSITSIAHWLESMDSNGESQPSTFGGSDNEVDGDISKGFSWTTVTDEGEVTEHLIALYFTWVHPFHPLFNEGHFVKSMRTGSEAFCSHSLFNAICAMGCYLHTYEEDDIIDYKQVGGHFCDLVRSSINPEDKSLTTIQAFAVMFLVRCAQGQGLSGSVYLTVATRSMESLRPSDNDDVDYRQIWRETVRGINSLNVEWAQMTFKMAPAFIPELQPTRYAEEIRKWEGEVDQLSWKQYRFPEDFRGEPTFPCLTATTSREKSKLIEIIRDATILLYNTTGPQIYAEDLLAIYRRLLNWRENLPEKIARTGKKDSQALPHVLSLHILYATATVHLLSPLLAMGESPVGPLVWQHAQEGLNLVEDEYRFQYSCRYQPVSQLFAILHLSEVLIRAFPEIDKEFGRDGVASIRLATEILAESHSSFPVAGVFMTMLQETARRFLTRFPNALEDVFRFRRRNSKYHLDDAMNACGGPTYVQPIEVIQRRFSPDMQSQWILHAASEHLRLPHEASTSRQLSLEETGAQNLMRILNLHNTK
ncbi:de89cb45-2a9a-49ba-a8cc-09cd27b07efc [Sclerotinia trifoliorum]|uniref:De89cb45-2a9a-49ba-a8cc-09cd27b07efc n=1 Tax=Sclerotinia trifoliorum TaxID=28548 RepID=A0A8H2W465_9HELO|nr:de89cb45-2a9a-49ba-a8cc-09cd27b07efc [Sclerotinia trifoliorum]